MVDYHLASMGVRHGSRYFKAVLPRSESYRQTVQTEKIQLHYLLEPVTTLDHDSKFKSLFMVHYGRINH